MRAGSFSLLLAAALLTAQPQASSAEPAARSKGRVHRLAHRTPSPVPTLGPDLAPVTIEFFLNLNDGVASDRAHRALLELAGRHPKRLRILYRLTPRRASQVDTALTLAQEAFVQGRFFPFLTQYYGGRRRNPSNKEFSNIAKAAEVDYRRVERALGDLRHQEQLSANRARAKRLRLQNHTGIVINGMPLRSVRRVQELEELYDIAYAESQAMLAAGVPLDELYERILERRLGSSFYPQNRPRSLDTAPGDELPETNPVRFDSSAFLTGGHRHGSEYAPVTLVFFCHLQSPYCRSMGEGLRSMQAAYPEEVQLVFHPLYDEERKGQENSALMYEASLCADEQDAFWAYTEQLGRRIRRTFDVASAVDAARLSGIGLDVKRFETCMESGRQAERAQQAVKRSRDAGLSLTPALAVGDLLYYGRLYDADLQQIIEAALKPGLLGAARAPDFLPDPLSPTR